MRRVAALPYRRIAIIHEEEVRKSLYSNSIVMFVAGKIRNGC